MARATYNPFYPTSTPDPHTGPPRIRFSQKELKHITGAVVILTLAFGFLLEKSGSSGLVVPSPLTLLAAFLAVGSGFVLHELAHKVVAQRYGFWAEFRAQFGGLFMALVIAILTPFLFAAPGAVMIAGRVTPKENGLISIVGPGVNFVLAAVTFPFSIATNDEAAFPFVMGTIAIVNALLAVFNLLPLGPLDGKKVWRWNRLVWIAAFAASVALFAATLIF